MTDAIRVRVARTLAHPPERVFDAWLDPAMARRFLFATPGGEMQRVEIDARVGGRFAIVERRGAEEAAHYGTYRAIDRPRRLAFAFSVEGPEAPGDPVTVDVIPREGGCEVRLAHEMKPEWAAHADQAKKGWAGILEALERAL